MSRYFTDASAAAAPSFLHRYHPRPKPQPPTASLHAFARIRDDVTRRMRRHDQRPVWHSGAVPSLRLDSLYPALRASLGSTQARLLTAPPAAKTDFEEADGRSFSLVDPAAARPHSATALSAALRRSVLPAARTADTRASYAGPWGAFLVYAFAIHREHEALPAHRDVLQAFIALLISADLVADTILRYLTAILDKHKRHDMACPLPAHELADLRRAIRRQTSHAACKELPVTIDMLHAMLQLPVSSNQEYQDILITAVATVLACRPSDAVNIEPCDFLLHYALDPPGTAAVRLWGMKNDPWRKGHHPRIGRASDRRFDLVHWILRWCSKHNILPHHRCSKPQHASSSCQACGTLFRRLHNDVPLPTSDPRHPLTTTMMTAAVRRVAARLHLDPAAFAARSCRDGGLSAGGNACLPDYMVTLQSGHARGNRSAPGYMTITDPAATFALWRAFRL